MRRREQYYDDYPRGVGGHRLVAMLFFLVVVIVSLVVGYFGVMYYRGGQIFKGKQNSKIERVSHGNAKLTFLMLGVDNDSERAKTEDLKGNRTDSIMYVTLNTKTKKITTLSIPRDSMTIIYNANNQPVRDKAGNLLIGKVNEAYEYGQQKATINTLAHFMPTIHPDYYIQANFIAFEQVVDAIGGVKVNVPTNIYDYTLKHLQVHKGYQTLNGGQALDMARARYQDNDIMRGKRQQILLKAIVSQSIENVSPSSGYKIVSNLKGNIKTDLSMQDLYKLHDWLKDGSYQYHSNIFAWNSLILDGASNVVISNNSRLAQINGLRASLGESPLSLAEMAKLSGAWENDLMNVLDRNQRRGVKSLTSLEVLQAIGRDLNKSGVSNTESSDSSGTGADNYTGGDTNAYGGDDSDSGSQTNQANADVNAFGGE